MKDSICGKYCLLTNWSKYNILIPTSNVLSYSNFGYFILKVVAVYFA